MVLQYADKLSDEKDVCFAIFNHNRKRIVALAHVAIIDDGVAELGMSVDKSHRGMGCGQLLMQRITLYCKANKIHDLKMECLRENAQMRGLAEKAGAATIDIQDGEVSALAKFRTDFLTSYAAQLATLETENRVFIKKTMQKTLIRTRDFLDKLLKAKSA
jgi:RimJ/RimL family protein N-acetyltransferase